MSAPANPSRGELRTALRAEWTKFRTVRGWIFGLLLAVAMVVLFSYLQAHGKHTGYCTTPDPDSCVAGHPYVPTGPDGEAVADSYEFVSRPLTRDGTITARITSLAGRIQAGPANEAPTVADTTPGLASWAKAGLLITTAARQGRPYAAVLATGGHGVRFQYDYTHDQAGLPGAPSAATPRWLRLTRSRDMLTGYDSADGTSWHRIGSAALPVSRAQSRSGCSRPRRCPTRDSQAKRQPALTTSPPARWPMATPERRGGRGTGPRSAADRAASTRPSATAATEERQARSA